MARAVDFEGTNIKLVAPEGQEDRVDPLYAFQNGNVVVTAWQFSPEEMEEFVRTGRGRIFVAQLSGSTIYPTFVGNAESVRALCIDYGKTFPKQTETA